MSLPTRLLAPVDFSAASPAAISYAASLASRAGGELLLLHAIPPAPFDFSMVGPSEQVLRDLAESREALALRDMERLELPEAHVRRMVTEGNPAAEILRVADAEQRDLIVMSTHGASALERVLGIGSVTLRVLGAAKCPVLTGTTFADAPSVVRGEIVCALDLGTTATRTLQWAGRAAKELGARLTVVHATTLADKKQAGFLDEGWDSVLVGRLTEHFKDLLAREHLDGDVVIDDGTVHEVVATVAARRKAGWVVVGRSASSVVLDRVRAHSYDIIRRSPCPVVSV